MRDLMIDLETLSTRSNAAIISIGARMFDRTTGELGSYMYARCEPDLDKYAVDLSTFRWWLWQNEAAKAELVAPAPALGVVLDTVEKVIKQWAPEQVWAMPPTFDLTILENALRTEGLGVPWIYNAPRCVRTACDLARLTKEDRVKPTVAHNALADCDAQIATLCVAFRKLGL